MPDVLVKGGDYKVEEIVGAKEVMANGGTVKVKAGEGGAEQSVLHLHRRAPREALL